jgi:hypothetical protein
MSNPYGVVSLYYLSIISFGLHGKQHNFKALFKVKVLSHEVVKGHMQFLWVNSSLYFLSVHGNIIFSPIGGIYKLIVHLLRFFVFSRIQCITQENIEIF